MPARFYDLELAINLSDNTALTALIRVVTLSLAVLRVKCEDLSAHGQFD